MRTVVSIALAALAAHRPADTGDSDNDAIADDLDMDCFDDKCHQSASACGMADGDCADRLSCMRRKGKNGASCFSGVTRSDLDKSEQAVVQCAELNRCLKLGPKSLLQVGARHVDDTSGTSDEDALAQAEARLTKFTKQTREKISHLTEQKRKFENKLGLGKKGEEDEDEDDEEESLLETRSVASDGKEKADPVEDLLQGLEAAIAQMQAEHMEPGEPSFAEVPKLPMEKSMGGLDDTTMIVALGALSSVLGIDSGPGLNAVSFAQSGDAVKQAFNIGTHLSTDPEFLSNLLGHPGYLPKEMIDQLGLEPGAPAGTELRTHPAP